MESRSRRAAWSASCAGALLFLAACGDDPLQRMRRQPKLLPYEPSPAFADGVGMRRPPLGTVPREVSLLEPEARTGWVQGKADAGYVEEIPVPITRSLLERGKKRFEIVCATCHGLSGDGQSLVARNMALKPPPSLHLHRGHPDGYFFDVISRGFGLMPPYGADIPIEERWAVVAYMRALQLSQHAALSDAPPEARAELEAAR